MDLKMEKLSVIVAAAAAAAVFCLAAFVHKSGTSAEFTASLSTVHYYMELLILKKEPFSIIKQKYGSV